ncbi:AtpZ/AtpI family protein [Candidatus Parcubacteria bacterium]|nr:AtpZ/AtpI family protein [Candidatus Parcubacteria bacterium]
MKGQVSLFCLFLIKIMAGDETKNSEHNKNAAWWQPSLILFAKFSGWIAAPVIIAAFLGRWLDKKYGTEPLLFLATVGFAFLISMLGLVKTVKEEYRKIEKENKKNNQDT